MANTPHLQHGIGLNLRCTLPLSLSFMTTENDKVRSEKFLVSELGWLNYMRRQWEYNGQ